MQRVISITVFLILSAVWFVPTGWMQSSPNQLTTQPQGVPPTVQGTPWLNFEDTAGMRVKIVRNTNTSGPDSFAGVLAEAISEGGNCWIQFQIPKSDPGFVLKDTIGYWRIELDKIFLVNSNRIFIDGYSQTVFSGDTNPQGPEILFDGRGYRHVFGQIGLNGNQNWIRGICMVVNQSSVNGIANTIDVSNTPFARSGATATGNRLNDNYLSINPDGETIPTGDAGGIRLDVGTQDTLVENNVICGNGTNILISGSFRFMDTGIPFQPPIRNIIRGNKIGTNAAGTKRLSPPSLAIDGDRLPYRAIDLEFANCAENIIENNIIAGTRTSGVGRPYPRDESTIIGVTAGSRNIIRNNRIGVGANGENIAPPAPPGAILDPNLTGPDDTGAFAVGIFAHIGDTVTGNIVGNFQCSGIQIRNNGLDLTPGPTVIGNTIYGSYVGIQAGQIDGTTISGNTIRDCQSGIVIADELLDAAKLHAVTTKYNPNPLDAPTVNVSAANNQFVNISGPFVALTDKVENVVRGTYIPNPFTLLQAAGPNRYQPTPTLTTASRNPDGSIAVIGATVGAGTLELYSSGMPLQTASVPGNNFTVTVAADRARSVQALSAVVTVAGQTSEMSRPVTVTTPQPDTQPPTVTVSAPGANQVIESKDSATVAATWTSADNIGVTSQNVAVIGTRAGAPFTTTVATGLPGTVGSFTVRIQPGDEYSGKIQVTATDAAGNTGRGESGMFMVKKPTTTPPDTEKPVVSGVTLSTKKVKRKLDPTLAITWKSTDNIGVTSHDLLFADTTPVVSGLPGATQSFTWTVPASIPKKTTGTIKVTARDAAGNTGEAVSPAVTIK